MTVVASHPTEGLVEEFAQTLAGKARSTAEVYLRILRHLTAWIAARPGNGGHFRPAHFTRTALETYLAYLEAEGYSVSHRARVKSAASSFAGCASTGCVRIRNAYKLWCASARRFPARSCLRRLQHRAHLAPPLQEESPLVCQGGRFVQALAGTVQPH